MFDGILLGAASSDGARVSPVTGPTRASDLSARSRQDGDAALSQKASEAAIALAQTRADPVVAKDKAANARHGKRRQTDASEDEPPRPKVKFKAPDQGGEIGPIFEEEGREKAEVKGDLLDEAARVAESLKNSDSDDNAVGRFIDVYA